jgi:hypothetical protein
MNIQRDTPEIVDWVYGIVHGEPTIPGDFLKHFAQAVVRADVESYAAIRPAIVILMKRFPKYKCKCRSDREETTNGN